MGGQSAVSDISGWDWRVSWEGEGVGVKEGQQGTLIFVGDVIRPSELIIIMLGPLPLLLLLLFPITLANQPSYVLSPELPPSAFMGQPYACQFQVSGLTTPIFSFSGLPKGFVGEGSGLLKGTPGSKGTFAITVSFASSRIKSSQQTLLRVAGASEYSVNNNSHSNQYPVLAIAADIDSYVFMAGTQVSMRFTAVMGTQPYQWTYLRLPTELTGTLDGSLSGFFQEEGYFSFGVAVGDREGQFAYCFITLNIQPLTFFTQWTPQALRSISDVPVKDYYTISASQQAWKNYYSAAQLLSTATFNASDAKNALKQAQKNMAKMNYTLDLAKQYLQASELQLALATLRKTQAEKIFKKTTADLAAVTRVLAERQSAFALAQYSANQSFKRLQDMQSICLKLSQLLQKASSELTQAQNNLINATSELKIAELTFNDSQDSVSNSLSAKDVASQQFQTVTVSSEKVFGDAEKAREVVNATKNTVAKAMDAFALANVTAVTALKTLSDANDNVSSLTKAANSAKNDLGQANMRLALALNQLYVAVAAKEQADKAMAFVSSQLTNTPQNGTIFNQKSSSFSGCSQGAFPSSFGSGQITAQIPSGFILQSGQKILKGSCTAGGGSLAIGDIIYFEGYLREGCIHAIRLAKAVPN